MGFGSSVFRRFLVIWVLAAGSWAMLHSHLGTNCPHALAPAQQIDGFVDVAMFGVEMPVDDAGATFFVETSRVPLVVGATFGWRMHLVGKSSSVKLREELVLPAPPRTWRHDGNTDISADHRTAVTERVLHTSDGWLENYWSFTDGDPEGVYALRIYIDDELAREFRFRVDSLDGPLGKGCGGRR